MKPVNRLLSRKLTGKAGREPVKSREPWKRPQSEKNPCLTPSVLSELLTTESLAVPGVEVTTDRIGKLFAGPFYPDQIDLLRDTLRGMPKRTSYIVVAETDQFSIHRRP